MAEVKLNLTPVFAASEFWAALGWIVCAVLSNKGFISPAEWEPFNKIVLTYIGLRIGSKTAKAAFKPKETPDEESTS